MIKIDVSNKNYPASAVIEALGYLPQFIDDRDPASARDQLDVGYCATEISSEFALPEPPTIGQGQ
jgi:hypothetical protein